MKARRGINPGWDEARQIADVEAELSKGYCDIAPPPGVPVSKRTTNGAPVDLQSPHTPPLITLPPRPYLTSPSPFFSSIWFKMYGRSHIHNAAGAQLRYCSEVLICAMKPRETTGPALLARIWQDNSSPRLHSGAREECPRSRSLLWTRGRKWKTGGDRTAFHASRCHQVVPRNNSHS
ncbi:hypothetical protein PENSPDRAFT_659790 [Peniophora sp. CONT]|nr:hypothetical protein PENSPDRAFT_659790 [Peniophora sp. CONT]